MSKGRAGHRYGWTGESSGRLRSLEQEKALLVAQHLLSRAREIDTFIPTAPKVGLQMAKARVRRAALDLLFQNQAEVKEVVEVLHDLAFDEAEAGFWIVSLEVAQDALEILLKFQSVLQTLPDFGYNQRVQNMTDLIAELKQLGE